MGTMGAVGHDEGEHNKTTAKWEWQQWRNGTPPTPSLTSHCSWGGLCMEWQQQQQLTTGRWWGWGKLNEKKAQEMSLMSLGPQVFFSHFIFILLTNSLGTNSDYWQQWTENTRGNHNRMRGREWQWNDRVGDDDNEGSNEETQTTTTSNQAKQNSKATTKQWEMRGKQCECEGGMSSTGPKRHHRCLLGCRFLIFVHIWLFLLLTIIFYR